MLKQHRKSFESLLGGVVAMAGRALKRRLGGNLALTGLDLAVEQVILLVLIETWEGVNQQTLTGFLPHDKTAVTRCIDVLEDKNLVVRVADREDRRQNKIFLTDRGRKMTASVLPVFEKTERQALKGVARQDVQTCKRVLRRIAENLSE